MNDVIETIEYRGHIIEIGYDIDPFSPREYLDFTKMYYRPNRNFAVGDEVLSSDYSLRGIADKFDLDFDYDDIYIREAADKKLTRFIDDNYIALIYSWGSHGCQFGSIRGHLFNGDYDDGDGIIIISKKDLRENWGWKNITKKRYSRVVEMLKAELKVYEQYCQGDVYGYDVDSINDSCWGFYDQDYMIEEAKSNIDYYIDQENKKKQAAVKRYIKSNVPLIYRFA